MTGFGAAALAPEVRIEIRPPFRPDGPVQDRLDAIWAEAVAGQPRLFNGRIYILADHAENRLGIAEAEYKLSFSLQKFPGLFASLPARPLAVTGLLMCRDGLVIGRRGRQVTSDTGLWEPAPAGSLSRPDPKAQVLEELEEELGLTGEHLAAIDYQGLVEDRATKITDIVLRLRTDLGFDAVTARQAALGNREHDALACLDPSEIRAFLADNQGRYIAALPAMLGLAGLA